MVPGNEQGDAMVRHLREQAGGENAGALFALRGGVGFLGQALHPHGRVVIVDQMALGRQGDQGLLHRLQCLACFGHEFPLRGGGHSNAQVVLHLVQPVMGQAAAKTQVAQHGADVGIVLFPARLRRCRCREGFAAEGAAQLLQIEAGRGKQGLGGNAHDLCGPLQEVEFALLAVRTPIARTELGVGHLDRFGAGVVGSRPPAMAFALGWRRGRGGVRATDGQWLGKDLASFLGLGSEDHPPQPADGGLLGFDGTHEPLEGVQ